MLMFFWLLTLATVASAQDSDSAPDEADAAAKRNAEYMNDLVRGYVAHALGEDGTESLLRLHEASLLNWSNPVSGVRPGGVYLWTLDVRPAAILKMYLHPRDGWFQQFVSLTPANISVEQQDGLSLWHSEQPDVGPHRGGRCFGCARPAEEFPVVTPPTPHEPETDHRSTFRGSFSGGIGPVCVAI
jgi:hypothetical protein